jgi:hypothetical protein
MKLLPQEYMAGMRTYISDAPVQIGLQVRNNVFTTQRLQLHIAMSELPVDVLDQGISNDHLACQQCVGLFLAFAIAAASRVGAHYIRR